MKKFKYIVSLGHFCSPAMEFEKIDRRQFSLPFDWLVTHRFSVVMDLINNNFDGFLNAEDMYQFKAYPQYYKNKKLDVDFYHDFSPFKSFQSQIDGVSEKYKRRIERFYHIVKEPTLFLRYITRNDVEYICKNYDSILESLKKCNPQNDILFVCNSEDRLPLENAAVYYVEKPANDNVSREFLSANEELKQYILEHVEPATAKKVSKKEKYIKMVKKVYKKIRLKLKLVYRHNQQC